MADKKRIDPDWIKKFSTLMTILIVLLIIIIVGIYYFVRY